MVVSVVSSVTISASCLNASFSLFSVYIRENIEIKENLDRLNSKLEHFQHMENTLHNTLIIAQETAEEVKLNAKRTTELMLKEAEIQARKMIDEASNKVRRLADEYEGLQKQDQVYRMRVRNLVQAQLDILGEVAED